MSAPFPQRKVRVTKPPPTQPRTTATTSRAKTPTGERALTAALRNPTQREGNQTEEADQFEMAAGNISLGELSFTDAEATSSRRSLLPSLSITAVPAIMDEAQKIALELVQKGKSALDEAGNMKRECKAIATDCIQSLYEIIIGLADSRNRYKVNLERERASHVTELYNKGTEHANQMQKQVTTNIRKIEQVVSDLEVFQTEVKERIARVLDKCCLIDDIDNETMKIPEMKAHIENLNEILTERIEPKLQRIDKIEETIEDIREKVEMGYQREEIPESQIITVEQLRTELKSTVESAVELTAPIKTVIDETYQELKNKTKRVETEPISYSNIVKRTIREPIPQPEGTSQFPIVVESTQQCTSHEILNRVKEKIDAIELGIGINSVRKAKNQKLIISLDTSKDRDLLEKELKRKDKTLKTSKIVAKNPLLKLIGVSNDIKDENEIVKAIRKQNSKIIEDIEIKENDVIIRRKTKGKNQELSNIIIEVPPEIWKKLKNSKLRIGYQAVPVVDQSPVVQCFKCLGYGHLARDCRGEICCGYCGEAHDTRKCPNKSGPPMCGNCKKDARIEDYWHQAYHPDCPVWQKWDGIARSQVRYN